MSDVIRFTLRGDVSWVNADAYPDAGGCNVLCLTDRQLSIVRQMVYPHALSPSRFAVPIFDRWFTYPTAALLAEHVDEVDGLLDKLGGGTTMDCDALLTALDLVADRLIPSSGLCTSYFNSALPAGTSVQTIYSSPAEKIVHVETICFMYAGTAPGVLAIIYAHGAVTAFITGMQPPVSNRYYYWTGKVTLFEGDHIKVGVYSGTLNDDLTVFLTGTITDLPA